MNSRLKVLTEAQQQEARQRRILAILKICKARNCLRRHPNVRYCKVTGSTRHDLQAIPVQSLPVNVAVIDQPGCVYYGRNILDYYNDSGRPVKRL